MNLEIVIYWNVETLYYVLNSVASIMQSSHFTNMLKFIFLFALMVGIFSYGAAGKTLELATWFLQALLLTTLLNLPITNVLITDKTGQEPPRVVGNVPLSLAVIAQASTMVFGRLSDFYETTFGIPGELGLAQGDVGFGHRILKQVNQVALRDPGLRSDLMQFIKECTLYDLKDGSISSHDIIG
ncbi:MAG: conjugal transfer protein TraG N-terminal domain-containing protein, partial [Rhodoferax sp.]|nr:conjugal transfer protein TraG N-terminal domain-containing protein [Rhodoferax sp.]